MNDTERSKVGRALDVLRNALEDYVDAAMEEAHGADWHQHVAAEDAKRRKDGRTRPVSKSDLAVMLKVIQHERIEPWGSPGTYSDPRIRSFASEILSLRNLFSHGDPCVNEHSRLLDTAARFLALLELPIPVELQPEAVDAKNVPDPSPDIAIPAEASIHMDAFERELSSLGEEVERLAEIFSRMAALPSECAGAILTGDVHGAFEATGAEAWGLLEETRRLEADGKHDSPVQRVLIAFIRCSLHDPMLALALTSFAAALVRDSALAAPDSSPVAEDDVQRSESLRRAEQVAQWLQISRSELSRELIRRAEKLSGGSAVANAAVIYASTDLLEDPALDDAEKLATVRDFVVRSRLLASMDPGSFAETWLVTGLRKEGALCNNLGRSEEAIQAFARADEIIDRYPAADPDLLSSGQN